MSEQADISLIRNFLGRVTQRTTAIAATEGAAAGLVFVSLLVLLRWSAPLTSLGVALSAVVAIAVGVVVRLFMSAETRRQSALAVERAAPSCHNLVVSADEILSHPGRVRDSMASLVFHQAASVVRVLDVSELFPAKRAATWLGGSAALLVLLLAARNTSVASVVSSVATGSALPSLSRVDIEVDAPAYAARQGQTLRDPSRIEALVGSMLKISVESNASSVIIETLDGKDTLVSNGKQKFSGTVLATADGFVAIEPSTGSAKGTRRLIGLTVNPDHAPRVKLTAPGKDMMFADGNRSMSVNIEADDDLALSTLKLRYTKVSGSGERFTFTEGEVPLQVAKSGDASWKAHVNWNLATLQLDAGDMVVYRAVAADKRPGAPVSESDSYIAEIKQVGSDAAAGFAIDPDQDKYALSQQMIIIKTERLIAKRASMTSEAFTSEASDVAVEQRRVRAEFVFMMGGELADEPLPEDDPNTLHENAEAEGESDILDGRGANRGRLALVRAVRAMSAVVTLLNEGNVPDALPRERTALKELEQAFSHTRIILRALTQAERLDLTRRMTGELVEAGRDVRPLAVPEGSARVVALRSALSNVAELLATTTQQPDASARSSALAERVLRVDASAKALQAIAASLNDAAAAFGKSQAESARKALEVAAVGLTESLRAELLTAPAATRSFGSERLSGALSDALRSTRGKR